MKKAEQAERLKEMCRLYVVEEWTLQEIADYFGITRQAIFERLVKVGISFRPKRPTKRQIERETLIELYINEDLLVLKTAQRLKTHCKKVSDELKRHEIKKCRQVYSRLKYSELNQLGIGENVIIPRPSIKKPHLGLYGKAKRIGIKISVKSVNKETMQVRRIE